LAGIKEAPPKRGYELTRSSAVNRTDCGIIRPTAHWALGLGAQAGERRLRQIVTQAGFSRFRRATETPFNMVLDARP